MTEEAVDYLIVGAGTAGCVLAARLSVDPHVSVALLECGGPDSNPAIYQPGLEPMFSLWAPDAAENWGYATTPQVGLADRTIDIARGRVLGGSSAVNAMIYIRGARTDFDRWAAMGAPGWSYDEVLPYFTKSERYHGPRSPYHGDNGPMPIIDMLTPSAASHAFVEASAILGAANRYNDFNGAVQDAGAGFYQSTRTPEGVRATAASAFLHPNASRSNLRILTRARVTKIRIEGGRAVGVDYLGESGPASLRADREVILCAGAFETPKLMMLSGLGPADHLASHGIAVVADLAGVGRDLQDHLLLGVGYECREQLDAPEMLAEAGLFTRTGISQDQVSPDLQYFFGPIQFVPRENMTDAPGFTFAPILSQPFSRGTVTLASSDPMANAVVDPHYLEREEDVAVLEYGVRYARELATTSAFDGLRGRELAPGAEVTSSVDLRAYIARVASTVWHPSSTCRMGEDAMAVVDPELRVYGVSGLRVADASVMPMLVNGNPNAAIMMIAEKAADFVRSADAMRPGVAIGGRT